MQKDLHGRKTWWPFSRTSSACTLREIKTEMRCIKSSHAPLHAFRAVAKTWKSPNTKENLQAVKNPEQLKNILENGTKSPRKWSTLLAMVSSLPPEDQPLSDIPLPLVWVEVIIYVKGQTLLKSLKQYFSKNRAKGRCTLMRVWKGSWSRIPAPWYNFADTDRPDSALSFVQVDESTR